MNDQPFVTTATEIRSETVQPIIREAMIVIAMVAIVGLALMLPGTGQDIPGTVVTIGDLILALGSLGIATSLIWIGPNLREMVVSNLEGSSDVINDAASIVRNLAVFAAVLVVHWGFAPVILPLVRANWVYDTGFLLLALVPLGVIAYRLYTSLDPLSEFLTTELLATSEVPTEEYDGPSQQCGGS